MKKVAGSLKLLYSQYRELQSFAPFGSDLDADTKARLALGERIVAVLKQPTNAPVEVAHQVCIIYAVVNGYLANIAAQDVREFEKQLFVHMDSNYSDALESIRTTGALDEAAETAIKSALTELTSQFVSAN
jgi:F-type H+-transporting ATPase subunit alpha